MLLYLPPCVLLVFTFIVGLRLLRFCQPCFAPPLPHRTTVIAFLPFFLLYALPSCPPVCMALWQAWHIPLDCDALWQKINTSPLVWYGDKTVIILMLRLCGPSFSLLIVVSDVLYWYHCCWSGLLLQRKELQFMCTNMRCCGVWSVINTIDLYIF